MTVDERLEVLLQSTESLHQTVHELTGAVNELSGTVHELAKASKADGEHIRALVRVAELHHLRITALEGGADEETGQEGR